MVLKVYAAFLFFRLTLSSSINRTRCAAVVLDAIVPPVFRVVSTGGCTGFSVDQAVAWGEYTEDMNRTGWSWLKIYTNASFTDAHQASAAGIVEGELTRERLDEFLYNTGGFQDFGPELKEYIGRNTEWVKKQITQHSDDLFWYYIGLAYSQLEGVLTGYNAARRSGGYNAVGWDAFYALTLAGDLDDLCEVFACHGKLHEKVANTSNSHCSALIKLVKGDIFVGHSTWSQFETMTRIYKSYNLAYRNAALPGHTVLFPSYPGVIVSIDDFYQTSAGLVVLETTNANANVDLWKLVKPESLLYWVRAFVSNLLATSGPTWAAYFSRHNSGTYNNQWMVIDTKLISVRAAETKNPLPSLSLNSLTVTELLPGIAHTEDMTWFLQDNGYWVSYNRPFFPTIFKLSGQPALVKKYGDHYSWEKTARAQIFQRLIPGVVDHASYQRAMRYNNFENDPVGKQGCRNGASGSNAIAERGDLTNLDAGCIADIERQDEAQTDVKYTTVSSMQHGYFSAITQSGPTYDSQPPFRWSSSPFAHVRHRGQPDLWQFPWINTSWNFKHAVVHALRSATDDSIIML